MSSECLPTFVISSLVARLVLLFRTQLQNVTLTSAQLALLLDTILRVQEIRILVYTKGATTERAQEAVRCFNDASLHHTSQAPLSA